MRTLRRTHRRATRGFSLIEVVISMTILASIFGTIALVQKRGESLATASGLQSQADLKAARIVDRVVRELLAMGMAWSAPDPSTSLGSDSITYRISMGVAGGVVQQSTQRSFVLQLAAGENDNGVDDDGDGLVDERSLVYTCDIGQATQRTTVLCDEIRELADGEIANVLDDNGNGVVDERGFSLHRIGDVMEVRVCVELASADGNRAIASVGTSFRVRN